MVPLLVLTALTMLPQQIAIGGGETNMYGARFGGTHAWDKRGGKGIAAPLESALQWLADQQDADGSWPGERGPDLRASSLALVALLGGGATPTFGAHHEQLAAGLDWLIARQDGESGRLGALPDHAVATLALCEAAHFTGEPAVVAAAQRAVAHLIEAGGPTSFDPEICGWSVLSYRVARDAGLEPPAELASEILAHFDAMTDRSGHVIAPGNEAGEAMTAVALFSRFLLGQRPDDERVMKRHAKDLLGHAFDASGRLEVDPLARHFGAYALFQMGGPHYWARWNQALRPVVLATRRVKGQYAGSWDPDGQEGRVRTTALNALNLEVYFRYAPLD